jgi:CBS domain containing-hemolysin-like protein
MIFFLLLLILLSAFLSGSETALFSLSPLAIKGYRASQNPRLELIARMMERPRDVLVTILMLNILANILIQNTVSTIFESYESLLLKIGVPLILTLIFGEVLPKSMALSSHTQLAYRVAPFIHGAAICLSPLRKVFAKVTSWISRLFFFFLREEKEISPDELRHVLKTSEERGVLTGVESDLIGGTLDLQNSTVKEHLRPRDEIIAYDLNEPLSRLLILFVDQETTRLPVYEKTIENLKGILSARDYFFHREEIKHPSDLLPILKKPYFLPETTRGWTALRNLRGKGINLAIVVDEYDSISGIITQEDLIEAVVGEIADLRDAKSLYTRSSEDVIIASGKLELNEFEEIFGISLKSKGNVVTLGGWLIEQLGDIPPTGAKYATDQFLFYVLAAEANRIRRLYVRRLKK